LRIGGHGLQQLEDVQRLIDHRIPEGQALEYKRLVELKGPKQRRELLKDVSGMGNGGGGTLVFGVDEDPNEPSYPLAVVPLGDLTLVPQIEDILHSGLNPPMLGGINVLAGPSGYVLAIEVLPSSLGPYMVSAYGDPTFYKRHGTKTSPMTEQEVRDSYLLASRGEDRRLERWDAHSLPPEPFSNLPWLSLSWVVDGVEEEWFNPATSPMDVFVPGPLLNEMPYHAELAGLNALGKPDVWSGGIQLDSQMGASDRSLIALFRLHRDGSGFVASELREELNGVSLFRTLLAQVQYAAGVLERLGLRHPVELDLRVSNVTAVTLDEQSPTASLHTRRRPPAQPVGTSTPTVTLRRVLLTENLLTAHQRNRLIRDFADRFYQAFGLLRSGVCFHYGALFHPRRATGMGIAGQGVWDSEGNQLADVDSDGGITNRDGQIVAWVDEGVVMDVEGNAMACLEFATGVGLPSDFVIGIGPKAAQILVAGDPGTPRSPQRNLIRPNATGSWSGFELKDLIPYKSRDLVEPYRTV
jgi:hypothetical protein